MISHHLHSTTVLPAVTVVRVKTVPLENGALHEGVQASIRHQFPSQTHTVTYQGTRYSKGMIVVYCKSS